MALFFRYDNQCVKFARFHWTQSMEQSQRTILHFKHQGYHQLLFHHLWRYSQCVEHLYSFEASSRCSPSCIVHWAQILVAQDSLEQGTHPQHFCKPLSGHSSRSSRSNRTWYPSSCPPLPWTGFRFKCLFILYNKIKLFC